MQYTKSLTQQRAEMKARIAAQMEASRTELSRLYVGKSVREGRYEFVVNFYDGYKAEIYCHFNGEFKSVVRFYVEDEYFVGGKRKMSKALLKALCLAFVNPDPTEEYNFAKTQERRGSAYRRSFRYDRWDEDCLFDNPFAPKGVTYYDVR